MKKEEINDAMRRYRAGVAALEDVRDAIDASMRAAEGIPVMQGPLVRLNKALGHLEQLGAIIASVPELARRVLDEKDVSANIRKQAQHFGVVLRYD